MPSEETAARFSYITKHSLDWLEQGGFQVVPIRCGISNKEALDLSKTVDALYFQGGPVYNSQYMHLAHLLLQEAVARKMPVWGTCHGFQMLIVLVGRMWPLDSMKGMRESMAQLKPYDTAGSPFIEAMTPAKKRTFYKVGGAPFNHGYGITVKHFLKNRILPQVFRILTTTVDTHGTEYVSMIEGRHLPLWGVQFHPENDTDMNWIAKFFRLQCKEEGKGKGKGKGKDEGKLVACPKGWSWKGYDLKCYQFEVN